MNRHTFRVLKKNSRENGTGETGKYTVSMIWRVHKNSVWDRPRGSLMRGLRSVHDRTTYWLVRLPHDDEIPQLFQFYGEILNCS